jgi:glycosyl-4,4'-diaponeurosporenoate acyltransferase
MGPRPACPSPASGGRAEPPPAPAAEPPRVARLGYGPAVLASLIGWSTLGLNLALWLGWGLSSGWWHRRAPLSALRGDGPVLRLRAFERSGSWYERHLRIRRWKDRLPETGGWFGDMSKKALPGRQVADLERFAAECCRGERTHWMMMAGIPVFAIWNSAGWAIAVAGFGLVSNVPFVLVLRYNRARLEVILARHGGHDSLDLAS